MIVMIVMIVTNVTPRYTMLRNVTSLSDTVKCSSPHTPYILNNYKGTRERAMNELRTGTEMTRPFSERQKR